MSSTIRVDRSIPGLRVVTENLPWCHTAAVGVWIAAGSADEAPDEHGAAHFLEHVLFKRTATASGRELSERIDLLGGDLNAYTGREHTCYHVHVPAEGLATAVDVLVDVVANGSCAPEDVEIERDVVLDELAGRADDPEDLACELATGAVLGDDPLARPIIGTEESVEALDAETLRSFHRRVLRAGDVVVAAAGRIDHEDLVRRIADGPLAAVVAAGPGDAGEGVHTSASTSVQTDDRADWAPSSVLVGEDDDSEQVLLALARRTPARDHRDRAAAQVATAVLGGGLSSRLFQRVREELGLAYTVYASMDQFRATGLVSVVAGSPVGRVDALSGALAEVVAGMVHDPPAGDEVDRAIGHLTGSIRLGLDDPLSRMTRIGRHLLDRDTVVTVEESLLRLRRVTRDDVAEYWTGETAPWCLAAVGPGMPDAGGAAGLLAGVGG
ncbi:M16 family metallopeptidase [Dietzia psychralcaliphila]|uniref:Peptidase M16 n=1 Tax=Dietzia psychralcaliphila TaxID=139021 RepID=A0AAD0NQ69_9ACTN|nr:pitrilysin family protein [Dietzia psychralcaliphila]AWH95639.1 peptidase M16 [Dietzia psychralcaliphila]PTM88600.1 putative Zn-dependent peptidase [Dietzia psychralcaliphila]